jgi:tRNA A58 N-methylase Trm61
MLVVARLILLDLAHNAPVVNNVPAGVRHDGMVCIFVPSCVSGQAA